MSKRTREIEQNQGSITREWSGIKSVAAKAWDATPGVVPSTSKLEQVATLNKKIAGIDSASPSRNATFEVQRNVSQTELAAKRDALAIGAEQEKAEAKTASEWQR